MTQSKDNIVLIGMPGAGKSTLGVVLAKIMNKSFIDADLVIQQQQGKTLQAIIDDQGADAFIAIEGDTLAALKADDAVIATGGSAVYSDEAMAHLGEIGTVVYLRISYDSLIERLGDLHERGVVIRGDAPVGLRGLFAERSPLYDRHADITVDVDGLSITEAAYEVVRALEG